MRPNSLSLSRRSNRLVVHRKGKGRILGDLAHSNDRVVHAKLANLRSRPATLRRAEAPEPTHPLQGNTNATGRSDPRPLLCCRTHPRRPLSRACPGQRQAQSVGSGRAISPISPCAGQIRGGRLPTTRREREHPDPAGGLRRRRERIGPSGRDELSAHILPRFQATRTVCANSSVARGQANLPAKNDLAGCRRWMGRNY